MRAMPLKGLLLLLVLALSFGPALAQQSRTARTPVASQPAPMTPSATPMMPGTAPTSGAMSAATAAPPPTAVQPGSDAIGAVIPAAGDIGICQCIADRSTRKLSCLSSAAECQSSCASTHYAFTPHAIYSCPMTPDAASASTSASR